MTTSANGVVQAYRHEAVLYRDVDDYVESLVPFIADGLHAGEPVLVAVPTERLATLRTALRGSSGLTFVDMSEVGSNPARIIPAWQAFIDDNRRSGTRLRGVGEPIWAGRRPVELAECNLHEALLNVAVARTPRCGCAARTTSARWRRPPCSRPSATTRGCLRTGPCTQVRTTTRTSP